MLLLELVIPEVDRIAWVEPAIRDGLAPSAVLLGRDSTVVDDVVAEMTQVAEEVRSNAVDVNPVGGGDTLAEQVGTVIVEDVVQSGEPWIGEGGIGWAHAMTPCRYRFCRHPVYRGLVDAVVIDTRPRLPLRGKSHLTSTSVRPSAPDRGH